jgi:predicted DNA binding protein
LQELTFEIPLNEDDQIRFPTGLLEQATILYLFRFGAGGYSLICQIQTKDWDAYEKETSSTPHGVRQKFSVRRLGNRSGATLLQVSGKWFDGSEAAGSRGRRLLDFFSSMERTSIYSLTTPSVSKDMIRITVAAQPRTINQLLNGLQELNIPYKIRSRGRLAARNVSVLSELTQQQGRTIRLAHTMGYYDIPRRTGTEELAKIMGMDKATVGEHLRRAEKNVFDKLLS